MRGIHHAGFRIGGRIEDLPGHVASRSDNDESDWLLDQVAYMRNVEASRLLTCGRRKHS